MWVWKLENRSWSMLGCVFHNIVQPNTYRRWCHTSTYKLRHINAFCQKQQEKKWLNLLYTLSPALQLSLAHSLFLFIFLIFSIPEFSMALLIFAFDGIENGKNVLYTQTETVLSITVLQFLYSRSCFYRCVVYMPTYMWVCLFVVYCICFIQHHS